MIAPPIEDLSRLCVHTITTRPWSIEEITDQFAAAGVAGITVWRQTLEGRNVARVGQNLRDAGLSIVSLCRGGFFPATDAPQRQRAVDDNLRAIDEAAELGAPLVVLVCGADPGQPLDRSRQQIVDGILAVHDRAVQANVRLGIEPLHPMYADTRSAINSMRQANDACDEINSPHVGVVVDVYHLWWDPDLKTQIERCGRAGRLFAFHVCDWRSPTEDMLNDRGLMGEGCINIPEIRGWVEQAGFGQGFIEVEIFSNRYWAMDQAEFLEKVKKAYVKHT